MDAEEYGTLQRAQGPNWDVTDSGSVVSESVDWCVNSGTDYQRMLK